MKNFALSLLCITFCLVSGIATARNGMTMRGSFKNPQDLKQALMSHLTYTNNPETLKTRNFDYIYEMIKMNMPLYRRLSENDRMQIEYDLYRLLTAIQPLIEYSPNGWKTYKRQYNLIRDTQQMLKDEGIATYDMMPTGTPMYGEEEDMMPMRASRRMR